MSANRSAWPLMVRIGLWKISRRSDAWIYFWICVAIGIAAIVYGFFNPFAFLGSILFLAAFWYYQSIRWVDHHSSWS